MKIVDIIEAYNADRAAALEVSRAFRRLNDSLHRTIEYFSKGTYAEQSLALEWQTHLDLVKEELHNLLSRYISDENL